MTRYIAGYDKLQRFEFSVNRYIDGFGRRILGLEIKILGSLKVVYVHTDMVKENRSWVTCNVTRAVYNGREGDMGQLPASGKLIFF